MTTAKQHIEMTTAKQHITDPLTARPDILAMNLRAFAAEHCPQFAYTTVRKAVRDIPGIYTVADADCSGGKPSSFAEKLKFPAKKIPGPGGCFEMTNTKLPKTEWTAHLFEVEAKAETERSYDRNGRVVETTVHSVMDSVDMDCPLCGRNQFPLDRFAHLESDSISVDCEACGQDDIEMNADGECIDERREWDWSWLNDPNPEDLDAEDYEYYAHGEGGPSEYDLCPHTVTYNDAGEPVGWV